MMWLQCSPLFYNFPYLTEEEDEYESPTDPDLHKSTEELGLDALSRLPRVQAIEGALAFQGFRSVSLHYCAPLPPPHAHEDADGSRRDRHVSSDRLKAYLRPLSEAGVTVTKAMIEEFFEAEKAALASRRG